MEIEVDLNLTAAPDAADALRRSLHSDLELVGFRRLGAFAIRWRKRPVDEGTIDTAIQQFLDVASPTVAGVEMQDKVLRVGAYVDVAKVSLMMAELESQTVRRLADIDAAVQLTFYPCST